MRRGVARAASAPAPPVPPPRRRPGARSSCRRRPSRRCGRPRPVPPAWLPPSSRRHPLASPSPVPGAPGSGPARRPSPRRTAPSSAAAPTRTSAAARPRRRRRRWPAPTATGRPTSAARAPSASALTTSGERRMPPSTYTSARPATASTISATMSAVAGASASWRAPWLETTTAAAPASTQRTASSARCTPLATTGRAAQPRQPPDVVGGQRGFELVGHHRHEAPLAGALGAVAGQVGQGQVVGQVHAHAPLAEAETRHRRVDGEDQGAVAVGGGAARPAPAVRARSRKMYTCIHRGAPGAAAATSSSGQVASDDRIIERPHRRRRPGAVAASPSGWARPWMAVGATATGELTGRPEQGRGGRDRLEAVDPGQHPRVELPVGPGRDVPLQQALVVGPARVVGVGHLPDGVAGVPLEVVEGEVGDQGRVAGQPDGVVPRRAGAGRMSGHGPHGRRPPPGRCRAVLVCRVDDGSVVLPAPGAGRRGGRATTPWSSPTASATPRCPTPPTPSTPTAPASSSRTSPSSSRSP